MSAKRNLCVVERFLRLIQVIVLKRSALRHNQYVAQAYLLKIETSKEFTSIAMRFYHVSDDSSDNVFIRYFYGLSSVIVSKSKLHSITQQLIRNVVALRFFNFQQSIAHIFPEHNAPDGKILTLGLLSKHDTFEFFNRFFLKA